MNDSLAARMASYRNSAAHNDAVHLEFTRLTDQVPFLKAHRDFVESNAWGFGDRAFHYMWLLVLADAARRSPQVKAMEIGVYKGQVISLWSLIAREMGLNVAITGISPFQGNTTNGSRWLGRIRRLLDLRYRSDTRDGNLYERDDYLAKVTEIFARFDCAIDRCRLIKGYSNDPAVLAQLGDERYAVIYIDGDHSYEGVRADIRNYAPRVLPGGYLVMDDAAFFLPGSNQYKGRESVSRACEEIPSMGFSNVLNIGHDRIYRKEGLLEARP